MRRFLVCGYNCNGWGQAFDVLHIFEDELGFKMPFRYCKIGGRDILEECHTL